LGLFYGNGDLLRQVAIFISGKRMCVPAATDSMIRSVSLTPATSGRSRALRYWPCVIG
jgi:hypothetical protein